MLAKTVPLIQPPNYLLGELASLLGRVEDFVEEHGEVEGQPKPDGVGGGHLLHADVVGVLVSLLGVGDHG